MSDKETLRRELLKAREAFCADELQRWSDLIVQRVVQAAPFVGARCIGCYQPFRGEVDCLGLLEVAFSSDKRVAFPRMRGERLDFVAVERGGRFTAGRWGVLEPVEGVEIPLDRLDLVLVPGIVFDRRGYRLGWGKGYYDRTLSQYEGFSLGLGYDFQLFHEIPASEGDQPLDGVVSEKRSWWRIHDA